jgi:hypothetical protein
MSQLGLSVMIHQLSNNVETVKAHNESIGKTIANAVLEDDELRLSFTDETGIRFWDSGQSCCESRYMRTDDDLDFLIGAKFLGAELKEAPDEGFEDEFSEDVHEVQFLEIKTNLGSVVLSSHVEHNGYYGGFAIEVRSFRVEVKE